MLTIISTKSTKMMRNLLVPFVSLKKKVYPWNISCVLEHVLFLKYTSNLNEFMFFIKTDHMYCIFEYSVFFTFHSMLYGNSSWIQLSVLYRVLKTVSSFSCYCYAGRCLISHKRLYKISFVTKTLYIFRFNAVSAFKAHWLHTLTSYTDFLKLTSETDFSNWLLKLTSRAAFPSDRYMHFYILTLHLGHAFIPFLYAFTFENNE